MKTIIIFTDPGSVDIDDWLALLLLRDRILNDTDLYAIVITTHHFATQRARMVWAFLENLPRLLIIVGNEPKNRKSFDEQNPLFPDLFGSPFPEENERKWFPDFGKAFDGIISTASEPKLKYINELPNIIKTRIDMGPVCIVVLAPPHDILCIPQNLYKHLSFFAMGGAQENDISGYNWGICPSVVNEWIQRLEDTNTTVTLVSSGLVRKTMCTFSPELYENWKSKGISPIQKIVMDEWDKCNRGNSLLKHKNLCDPLTLYLAFLDLNQQPCHETVVSQIKINALGNNYLESYMQITKKSKGPILNIVSYNIGTNLIDDLDRAFMNI